MYDTDAGVNNTFVSLHLSEMNSSSRIQESDRTRMVQSDADELEVSEKEFNGSAEEPVRQTFFSSIASSAKRVVSKLKAAPSSSSSTTGTSFPAPTSMSKEALTEEQRIHLTQLGIYDRQSDLDNLINKFNEICVNEAVSLEKFVISLIKQGHDPMWADAAFRAFDLNCDGEVTFYEFILADLSLRVADECSQNDFWLALRRRVIFTIYDRSASGKLGRKDLVDLLDDMSISDKSPLIFGVRNTLWTERQDSNKNLIADEFNLQVVTQVC